MNAYQLMMFLLLFNVSISIVIGLGIYNSVPEPSDIPGESDVGNISFSTLHEQQKSDLLAIFGSNVIIGLVSATVIGGALSFITQVPGDAAFAYSFFISFYWTMAKNTVDVLYLLAGSAGVGLSYIVAVFVIILVISFISFLIQLVRGPWATMR